MAPNGRIGWLRAAVLGANAGIVFTTSLVIGVAAPGAAREDILRGRIQPSLSTSDMPHKGHGSPLNAWADVV
jgi:vacuolar iron transporter family protein